MLRRQRVSEVVLGDARKTIEPGNLLHHVRHTKTPHRCPCGREAA
jgi:hypothetical protein